MIKETLSNEESGVEAKEDVASVGENKKPLSLKEKLSQLNESIASEVKENGEKFKNKVETLKDEIEKVKSERTVLAGEGRSAVKEASILTEEQKASVGFEEGFKDEIRGPLAVLRAKQQELEKQLVDADREYSYTMEKKNLLAYSQNSGVEGKSILNRMSQLEEQKTNDIAKVELNQKISPEINKVFVYPKNILDLENEATYITSETRKLTEQFSEKDVLQKVKNKYLFF